MRAFIAEKPSFIPTISGTLTIIPEKWGHIVKEKTKDQTEGIYEQ